MRIIGIQVENFKKVRLVEIVPKGRMIAVTGRPGQGKTSILDAFLSAIGGKHFSPDMPVRKGAKNAKLKLILGASKVEWTVLRSIHQDGTHSLELIDANGRPQGRGQGILDDLYGDIWMDPTEFVRMKPKEQIEILRKVAKIEMVCACTAGNAVADPGCADCKGTGKVTFDADRLNALNYKDFTERTQVGREVKRLEGELSGMTVQDGLPAAKVDDAELLEALNTAGAANKRIEEERKYKANAGYVLEGKKRDVGECRNRIAQAETNLANAEAAVKMAKEALAARKLELADDSRALKTAQAEFDECPEPEFVDVSKLSQELQQAQLVNREIDKRERRVAKEAELNAKRREVEKLTRAIDDRNEKKAAALGSAKMPVEGLTFDEDQVLMRGIPLQQLGKSEQIRVCTAIAMAEKPKLRVLPIRYGESLGEEGIAMLAAMAEEHDFQILMAMVDESGKRGYVIEDGLVAKENE
jgi:hypothetical protein